MNRINRKLEYALIALKHMSAKSPGELSSAKEISEQHQCPFDATAKVMQVMASKGLLKSEQGVHGGYQIIRDLNKVSVHDLMEMIVGPVELARCLNSVEGEPPCDMVGACIIQSPMATLNSRLEQFYRSLSLADLLQIKDRAKGQEVRVGQ